MNKKRWITGVAAVILTILAVKGISRYSWSRLSAEEKAGKITEKMSRYFHLTEEQKGKMYALNLEKIQIFEKARNSGQHDRAQWKQLRQQWKDGIRNVLTSEQQQKIRH